MSEIADLIVRLRRRGEPHHIHRNQYSGGDPDCLAAAKALGALLAEREALWVQLAEANRYADD